jgi:hypothetical protein
MNTQLVTAADTWQRHALGAEFHQMRYADCLFTHICLGYSYMGPSACAPAIWAILLQKHMLQNNFILSK